MSCTIRDPTPRDFSLMTLLISDVIYGRSLFFEVDWHLVTENGSVTPICSLSPSLTVLRSRQAAVCLIGATVVAASDGGLCKIIHPKYRHYKHMKEDAIAVITHFCSKRWWVENLRLIGAPSDGDQNTIWRYFVSMRLCLAMLLYVSKQFEWNLYS